jgi:hypothetical protein
VAKWWVPDEVRIVEALPIGPTGKVLKRELRATLAGAGKEAGAGRPKGDKVEAVRRARPVKATQPAWARLGEMPT